MNTLYATIIDIYLTNIDIFQERFHGNEKFKKNSEALFAIYTELIELINMCNESFRSIAEEYGGGIIHIKNITDDVDTASIII